MKLITEQNFQVEQFAVLDEETKKKSYFIEGVFMQGEAKNRNGRMYPIAILEREMDRYNREYVQQKRAYGELGHPDGPTINMERVSHLIVDLHREGNDIVGKAKVFSRGYGELVQGFMEEGCQLGVSSRGVGSVRSNRQGIQEVQDDFILATAGDIVADPSAPKAFVNGIMEGVDFIYNAAAGNFEAQRVISDIQEQGHRNFKKINERRALAAFQKFMDSL